MPKENKTVKFSTGMFFVISDEYGREKVKIPLERLRVFQILMNEEIDQLLEQCEKEGE